MRRFAPFLIIVAALVVVVVLFTFRGNQIPTAPGTASPAEPPPPVAAEPVAEPPAAPTLEPAAPAEAVESTAEESIAAGPVTDANWEEKLDQLLSTDKMDEDVKADKIADMIPKVSEHAQKELAEHLINLMPDESYEKAAAILKSETTPASVSKVLLDDLFNRSHSLMLPLVLDVAKNEKHPLKGDAREMLEMFLQEDHGTNWNQWTEAVDKTLKGENP